MALGSTASTASAHPFDLLSAGCALVLAAVAGCSAGPDRRVERLLGAMGTELRVEVEAADRATALAASEAAVRATLAAEERLSNWDASSELSRLERGELAAPSPELAADLASYEPFVARTESAFDPGHAGRDGVDTGGFGKGLALDLAARAVLDAGAERARLDLGGQVRFVGATERRTVLLADPRDRGRAVARVELPFASIATTGDSERPGHVVDPRTGRPVHRDASVSVSSDSALAADTLSTGFYVLGPDRALELAADDVAVLALVPVGDRLELRASAAFAGRVTALTEDVVVDVLGRP
ncbi:MAG: FAD:protein FMN transferase [Planctomycetota bacterium]